MDQNKKNRLLVVEDSADLLDLTKELFESEGYEVYCASNGLEALDFLRKASMKVDLILLDLMMPVMDGYQFRKLQMLDANISAIPVVVITADGNAKIKANQLGAQGYFTKAGGLDHLLEVVRQNVKTAS